MPSSEWCDAPRFAFLSLGFVCNHNSRSVLFFIISYEYSKHHAWRMCNIWRGVFPCYYYSTIVSSKLRGNNWAFRFAKCYLLGTDCVYANWTNTNEQKLKIPPRGWRYKPCTYDRRQSTKYSKTIKYSTTLLFYLVPDTKLPNILPYRIILPDANQTSTIIAMATSIDYEPTPV